jgi:hypothetical protein
MSERDPWLTEREAAKELRVSAYVVRAERLAGRLKFAKIRSRVFYPMSDINAYKANARCPDTSSGSIQTMTDTMSPGLSEEDRIVQLRARRAATKHRSSSQLSS